ncbi:MAG TPA: LPS export ABC transporter periplasmic protein LptC [Blastocatellia bacterium]|nr:LPS export ABC transporter periplasmic protein LptC [Blastocatellia bacterium]
MFRVRLLSAGKLAAAALFLSILGSLVAYLSIRGKRPDDVAPAPKLQGRVVAVFNNSRYAHEVEGRVRFAITAGVDRTYEDGSHELEQVRLESYGADGTRNDVVTADRAKVSNPSDLNRLDAEFLSNVVVQIADSLTIKTSYLHYDHVKSLVETSDPVEFEGANIIGRSTGALIETLDERVRLLKDVDITIKSRSEKREGPGAKNAVLKNREKREGETPEEKAARKARKRARKREARARGERAKAGPGNPAGRKPTRIQSAEALLERKEGRVTFTGGVAVTQAPNSMRSDRMVGYLDQSSRIERIEARGGSHLKQGDSAEIKASDMDFFFGEESELVRALATGDAYTRTLGAEPVREAKARIIEAFFVDGPQGHTVERIRAEGDAAIRVSAPEPANEADNPAARELTASTVSLQFYEDGRNIRYAEAESNAVMQVVPVRAGPRADKKTIRAPRMSADFYEQGNRVKSFNATGGVKVEIEPTVAGAAPPRVTTSTALTASFSANSQDIERITQEGDFKYNEGDRNGVAERASYDGTNEVLSLRGKRPMVWDAKARTQADEIDYDRRSEQTHARGDVRTTYYSRESAGDSTPFKNSRSPVFLTAERAEASSREGVAIYIGNARGWQDDNFVKGDRIELYEKERRMVATGNVESALYSVKREVEEGKREIVPGFATADRMTYSDADRIVHYDGQVKARQGADRIEASSVDVYLKKETSEVDRLLAEGSVLLTQPGRRAAGDHLDYTAEDGRAVLTGRSARVDDAEKGSTMGAKLTFYSHDDKITVENQQGTGRVRSTHRLTKKE